MNDPRRTGLPACVLVFCCVFGTKMAAANDPALGLLGDRGGVRTALGEHGISFNLNDSENLLGSLAGGIKRGATLQGVATGVVEVDAGKAFGLAGGTFHVSALQIHGQPLSPSYLANLQAANGNEAEDATRLWELWYDQKLNGALDIKLGQQSIDNDFMASTYSGLFVNTMAGWPLIPSDDLYGGGPAYPLSSLGARVQIEPTGNTTILVGVFDDNPGGGAFGDDTQFLDRNGGRFNTNTGALFIAEVQYATKLNGLPGTYKLGGWYDSGHFPDQRFGDEMHAGNDSLYGVVDQTVWTLSDVKRLNAFGRVMAAPDTQNLIDFSFNGGLTVTAPLASRPNDQAGIDFGLGRVSRRAAAADRDAGVTARGTEELVELTYQAQAAAWLVLQPDMQFITHPGGGLADPAHPSRDLRDELVVGARAIVTF